MIEIIYIKLKFPKTFRLHSILKCKQSRACLWKIKSQTKGSYNFSVTMFRQYLIASIKIV